MMKIVHKTQGGQPVEIARKNWEDQADKKSAEWCVVHEGNPVVLLKKKQGSTDYEEDQLYDLELTPILFGRYPDEYKIMDYKDSKIKPVVPINREKLGEKYLRHFNHIDNVSTSQKTISAEDLMTQKILNQQNSFREDHDELEAEELDLDDVDAQSAITSMDDFEYIDGIKDDLGRIMLYLSILIIALIAFVGGYYFRGGVEVGAKTLSYVISVSMALGTFLVGFGLRNIIDWFSNKGV